MGKSGAFAKCGRVPDWFTELIGIPEYEASPFGAAGIEFAALWPGNTPEAELLENGLATIAPVACPDCGDTTPADLELSARPNGKRPL